MPHGGSGFPGNQPGSSEVPGADVLVIDVQSAAGHPTDIQSSRANTAQVPALVDHGVEPGYQRLQGVFGVGESGGKQRLAQLGGTAVADGRSVEGGPRPLDGL